MKKNKLNLNKKLLRILYLLLLIGFILIVVGAQNDNDVIMYIGFSLFPLFGILKIPSAIKSANNECKLLDKKYGDRKFNLDKKLLKNENIDIYHSKIVFKTIISVIINVLLILIVMVFLFYIVGYFFVNDGPSRLRECSMVRQILPKYRNIEGVALLIIFGIMIFGIPIFVYYITYNLYKVRMILNKRYSSYCAKVSEIDSKNKVHLIGKTDNYTYILDNYKCIGISRKNILNKDVILVFGLEDVYILPVLDVKIK